MKNPVRCTSSRPVYQGSLIHLRLDDVVQPQGTETTYEIGRVKDGSSTLALVGDNQVVLVREYKYALERASLEVVSGGVEPGEEPLEAAKRELREEAGLVAREWIPLGCVDPFTTMIRCANYLFLARGCDEVDREPEEAEVMEVHRVPLVEAVELVMRGDITHATSCALILKAAEWLRRQQS